MSVILCCVLNRREAFLLWYVSLHDQAQEKPASTCAVSPPWSIWWMVCGSPWGACEEATQTLLYPAADRGAQTTTWRHTGLTEHYRESVRSVLLLTQAWFGFNMASVFVTLYFFTLLGRSGFCHTTSHAGYWKCLCVPGRIRKHHHHLRARSVLLLFKRHFCTSSDVLRDKCWCFSQLFSAESSDLSAQNALDLLLNMSNARELVGNTLQVGGVVHQVISFYISNLTYMCKQWCKNWMNMFHRWQCWIQKAKLWKKARGVRWPQHLDRLKKLWPSMCLRTVRRCYKRLMRQPPLKQESSPRSPSKPTKAEETSVWWNKLLKRITALNTGKITHCPIFSDLEDWKTVTWLVRIGLMSDLLITFMTSQQTVLS